MIHTIGCNKNKKVKATYDVRLASAKVAAITKEKDGT
jgi:hypothetical protein